MKTNKMLPDSSISKVWENFRKMNGIILELSVANWVAQSNGTFTNTIYYEGFTSDEILEVDLYDDGNLTETQISEYDEYITEFNILDGMIIATATTQPTQDINILCRGEIVGEKVVVNGGGSSSSGTAKDIVYDGSVNELGDNVQDAITNVNDKVEEQSKNFDDLSKNFIVCEEIEKNFDITAGINTLTFTIPVKEGYVPLLSILAYNGSCVDIYVQDLSKKISDYSVSHIIASSKNLTSILFKINVFYMKTA